VKGRDGVLDRAGYTKFTKELGKENLRSTQVNSSGRLKQISLFAERKKKKEVEGAKKTKRGDPSEREPKGDLKVRGE